MADDDVIETALPIGNSDRHQDDAVGGGPNLHARRIRQREQPHRGTVGVVPNGVSVTFARTGTETLQGWVDVATLAALNRLRHAIRVRPHRFATAARAADVLDSRRLMPAILSSIYQVSLTRETPCGRGNVCRNIAFDHADVTRRGNLLQLPGLLQYRELLLRGRLRQCHLLPHLVGVAVIAIDAVVRELDVGRWHAGNRERDRGVSDRQIIVVIVPTRTLIERA